MSFCKLLHCRKNAPALFAEQFARSVAVRGAAGLELSVELSRVSEPTNTSRQSHPMFKICHGSSPLIWSQRKTMIKPVLGLVRRPAEIPSATSQHYAIDFISYSVALWKRPNTCPSNVAGF